MDRFIFYLLGVVGLAYFFPEPAHILPLEAITSAGVSLVFFFYGLKLSRDKLQSGLSNWRLHVLIQLFTFLVFPLVVWAVKPLFSREDVWLGLFFLAALPSTVSSSVVMVSMARGNMPAAIFNASLSGLIGIFITPLWMQLFQGGSGGDFTEIYLKLLYEILLPIVLGFLLQRWWGKYVKQYSSFFSKFDRTVILAVIYKSFVHSFEEKVFASLPVGELLILGVWVLALFALIYGLIYALTRRLGFAVEDKITALFCGTKKSLVHGTVFAKVFWGNSAVVGIYLLPLMLFHALQILIVGLIAGRYAKRK
jgi:sodium/bile acid cotransporter 7